MRGPSARLDDSYHFVWIVVRDLLSRARPAAETERRRQRAQVWLDHAAHSDEHALDAKRGTQCRDRRGYAGQTLGQQRDDSQERSAHGPQSPSNRAPRARQADRPRCIGGVHLLDGFRDAAGPLDGVYNRFDGIERAAHPSR